MKKNETKKTTTTTATASKPASRKARESRETLEARVKTAKEKGNAALLEFFDSLDETDRAAAMLVAFPAVGVQRQQTPARVQPPKKETAFDAFSAFVSGKNSFMTKCAEYVAQWSNAEKQAFVGYSAPKGVGAANAWSVYRPAPFLLVVQLETGNGAGYRWAVLNLKTREMLELQAAFSCDVGYSKGLTACRQYKQEGLTLALEVCQILAKLHGADVQDKKPAVGM